MKCINFALNPLDLAYYGALGHCIMNTIVNKNKNDYVFISGIASLIELSVCVYNAYRF